MGNIGAGRPLIAVVGRLAPPIEGVRRADEVTLPRAYVTALRRGGAQEVVVTPVQDGLDDLAAFLARVDGALVVGGGDVDPSFYGASPDDGVELGGVQPIHDSYEIAFIRAVLAADLPLLAICRGMQIMNVALGGTLRQHVEGHRRVDHVVDVVAGSRTAIAMGVEHPTGASSHHQVIDRVGDGLVVTARSPGDGYVEGAELPAARWVVGVQWHPEKTADDDPVQQALFDGFVQQCRRT